MPTRRQFLRQCSGFAATVAVAPAALGHAAFIARSTSAAPGLAGFAAQVGTCFHWREGALRSGSLRLTEVRDFQARQVRVPGAPRAVGEQFALRFSGPAVAPLAQGTYRFTHDALGELAIFVTRIGPEEGQEHCYEAVFNRVTPAPSGLAPTAV